LVEREVDFIVVGGVCAALHGVPLTTYDLEVVHSRDLANIDRLMSALDALQAVSRLQQGRTVKPDRSHLESPGHQLLSTRFGSLDLLGEIGRNRGYDQLLPRTTEIAIGGEMKIRLLTLEALIEVKEETGQVKDLAVLPLLRRTLEEKSKI